MGSDDLPLTFKMYLLLTAVILTFFTIVIIVFAVAKCIEEEKQEEVLEEIIMKITTDENKDVYLRIEEDEIMNFGLMSLLK